jgi:hypothetical protein
VVVWWWWYQTVGVSSRRSNCTDVGQRRSRSHNNHTASGVDGGCGHMFPRRSSQKGARGATTKGQTREHKKTAQAHASARRYQKRTVGRSGLEGSAGGPATTILEVTESAKAAKHKHKHKRTHSTRKHNTTHNITTKTPHNRSCTLVHTGSSQESEKASGENGRRISAEKGSPMVEE